jgi:uncharacterized protein (DUF952 family)
VRRVFHLLPWADWEALLAGGPEAEHRPASLSREGFVHLSFAEQLPGTLRAHFAGAGRLALVELAPRDLGAALVVEPSRGGAPFPHLYRALRRGVGAAPWPLEPAAGQALPPEHAGGPPD